MPIFMCEECGCIENTALSNFWDRYYDAVDKPKPALCSECDPDIKKWHGSWEKKSAAGMILMDDGFLYSKDEFEKGKLGWRMRNQGLELVREITEDEIPKVGS